jgi:hypothetical protein
MTLVLGLCSALPPATDVDRDWDEADGNGHSEEQDAPPLGGSDATRALEQDWRSR